jgi:hypothetical protein
MARERGVLENALHLRVPHLILRASVRRTGGRTALVYSEMARERGVLENALHPALHIILLRASARRTGGRTALQGREKDVLGKNAL